MPRMFIPALGTKLRLTKDMDFSLICEMRNRTMWALHHTPSVESMQPWCRRYNSRLTPLYEGDTFKVERIYIRKDQEGFNSVTLRGETKSFGVYLKVRFWMTLDDFNKMEAEVIE